MREMQVRVSLHWIDEELNGTVLQRNKVVEETGPLDGRQIN